MYIILNANYQFESLKQKKWADKARTGSVGDKYSQFPIIFCSKSKGILKSKWKLWAPFTLKTRNKFAGFQHARHGCTQKTISSLDLRCQMTRSVLSTMHNHESRHFLFSADSQATRILSLSWYNGRMYCYSNTAAVMSHECQCQTWKMQSRYAYNSRRIPYSFCLFPFISLLFLQHFARMSK